MKTISKNNLSFRVLGIDPGTATTGWAIVEEDKNEARVIGYGQITTSQKLSLEERLSEISRDIAEIIQKYRPKEAAVESLFFFKNQKTVMEVGQARGAIVLTICQKRVRMASYTPLQVKQALTGYGRAHKKQIQLMTKGILRLDKIPRPDDAADAIAIALCHLNSRKVINLKKKYGR